MSQPVCTIIAGPNGAGKSTFAEMQAQRMSKVREQYSYQDSVDY